MPLESMCLETRAAARQENHWTPLSLDCTLTWIFSWVVTGGGDSVVAPGRGSTGPVKNPSPPMHNSTTTVDVENYNIFLHQQPPPPPPNSPVVIDLTVETPENRSVTHVIDLTDAIPTPPTSVIDLTHDTEPVTDDEEELNEALNVWEKKAKEEADSGNYGGGHIVLHRPSSISKSHQCRWH